MGILRNQDAPGPVLLLESAQTPQMLVLGKRRGLDFNPRLAVPQDEIDFILGRGSPELNGILPAGIGRFWISILWAGGFL